MSTDPGDYIHRRIKRALAFKAMREMRKTVDGMEAEEQAGADRNQNSAGNMDCGSSDFFAVAAYTHITKAPVPEEKTESLFPEITGSITSWDIKNSAAVITLSAGKKTECSIYSQTALKDCTIRIFNSKELKSLEGLKLSLYKLEPPPHPKRSVYSIYEVSPKDSTSKSLIGVITASSPL